MIARGAARYGSPGVRGDRITLCDLVFQGIEEPVPTFIACRH
jgi:hypothetical protein